MNPRTHPNAAPGPASPAASLAASPAANPAANPADNPILRSTSSKLHRATILIDRLADEYLASQHGIRYPLFLVLLMVRVLGPTTQQAIADNLAVTRASVSQRVSALVARGLLAVVPNQADARAHSVSLTDEGAALVERAWRGLEDANDGLDSGVDERALAAELDALIDNALRILGKRQ
jgi:DNA-binding MarR family transcriptional regulator